MEDRDLISLILEEKKLGLLSYYNNNFSSMVIMIFHNLVKS